MFNRTVEEFNKIMADARAFAYYAPLLTQCFFILYYVGLTLLFGFSWFYTVLFTLTVAALIFFLFTERKQDKKNIKIRKWARISVRYVKYCVHITAISLNIYTLYAVEPHRIHAFSLILLVFAMLALFIQFLGELIGFLASRYFQPLLDAAVEESEFLRTVIGKVQNGAEALKATRERITAIPRRTAEVASGIKGRLTDFFHSKKKGEATETEYEDEMKEEIHN